MNGRDLHILTLYHHPASCMVVIRPIYVEVSPPPVPLRPEVEISIEITGFAR